MTQNRESRTVPHLPGEYLHEFMLAAGRTTPDAPAVVQATGDRFDTFSYRWLERQVHDYTGALEIAALEERAKAVGAG